MRRRREDYEQRLTREAVGALLSESYTTPAYRLAKKLDVPAEALTFFLTEWSRDKAAEQRPDYRYRKGWCLLTPKRLDQIRRQEAALDEVKAAAEALQQMGVSAHAHGYKVVLEAGEAHRLAEHLKDHGFL